MQVASFWERVRKGSANECWEWQGWRTGRGYGRLRLREADGTRRIVYAHRLAYELAHGTISASLDVCHSCDNPPCCNPVHLFTGTRSDNMQDCAAKGRSRNGFTGPIHDTLDHPYQRRHWKLTAQDVHEIRLLFRLANLRAYQIAPEFGVTPQMISAILRGESWAWLEDQSKRIG
jgi:hypothetical protein